MEHLSTPYHEQVAFLVPLLRHSKERSYLKIRREVRLCTQLWQAILAIPAQGLFRLRQRPFFPSTYAPKLPNSFPPQCRGR